MKVEGFRIVVRRIAGHAPPAALIERVKLLIGGVKKMLAPLRLGSRLHLGLEPDEQIPPVEWLVVSIEPSGQQDLFQDVLMAIERDFEAEREAGEALALAHRTILALRTLAEIARLTPAQFHAVLRNLDGQVPPLVAVGPRGIQPLVVRDPAGADVIAPTVIIPRRVTLDGSTEITFRPTSVGLYSAEINLRMETGRFFKRRDTLYWGRSVAYKRLAVFFFRALRRQEILTCLVRETANPKGKIVRYE